MTTPDSTATDDAELRNAPAEGTGGLIVIVYSPMQSGCHRQLLGRACRGHGRRRPAFAVPRWTGGSAPRTCV